LIDEDRDRLLRHLALTLRLGVARLGAVEHGLGARDVERRRERAFELGPDELERTAIELDRLAVDRDLSVVAAQRVVVRRELRLEAEASETPVRRPLLGAVDLDAGRVADRRPEVRLPGRDRTTGSAWPGDRCVGVPPRDIHLIA